jgi:hypothetical protein
MFDPTFGRRVDRKREFGEGKKKRNKGRPIHFGSLDNPLKREISTQKGERYGASKAEGTEVRDEDRIYCVRLSSGEAPIPAEWRTP